MKNLAIIFSLLLLLQNIASAQQNNSVDSISIMHQDRLEKNTASDWKNGMDKQKRKIVITYTILGAVGGGAVGKSIPFAKQLGHNISEHHSGRNIHLESVTTLKSTVVGVVVGAGVGYVVGKIRAKRRATGKKSKLSNLIKFI